MGKDRATGRVGSGRVRLFVGNRGSGRVGSTFCRVGSGRVQEKWPRGQLWHTMHACSYLTSINFYSSVIVIYIIPCM